MSDTKTIVATYHDVEIPNAPHFGPNMIRSMQEGRYERHEVQAALAIIPAGARILELGAGSGIVGAIMAKNCKPEAILSIEANPELIPHIDDLHSHNGLSDLISIRHGVVLSETEPPNSIDFFLRGNFLGSALTVLKNPHKARKVSVPVIAYDALKQDFPHDVIMMDIEGGELDFFRHADLTGVNIIIAELHRDIYGREGMQECRSLLEKAGFAMDEKRSKVGVRIYRRTTG